MEKHVPIDETLSDVFCVDWSQSRPLFLPALKKHLSIMAVSDEIDDVMGILINTVQRKDELMETVEVENEGLKVEVQNEGII